MDKSLFIDTLGVVLIITGILDALKYRWESRAIKRVRTAKGHSRKFINVAILNDIVRIIYLSIKFDLFLFVSSLVAIVCMVEMWWTIYKYYPYRKRRQPNFKRPNPLVYFTNSLLPNEIRKHL